MLQMYSCITVIYYLNNSYGQNKTVFGLYPQDVKLIIEKTKTTAKMQSIDQINILFSVLIRLIEFDLENHSIQKHLRKFQQILSIAAGILYYIHIF